MRRKGKGGEGEMERTSSVECIHPNFGFNLFSVWLMGHFLHPPPSFHLLPPKKANIPR